ncbi:hypothetical protein [Nocardia sp. NPDC052566]|uniref:hypothetical protein n=1 Tax=Nocardia sp. NPDC052566 TaxID=3364330 RepID=UPI0037CC8D2B
MPTKRSRDNSPVHTYRQRGAQTRVKRTTAAVVQAAEQALMIQLATRPAEPLSRMKMATICDLGKINKTTLFRRFKTVEAVGAAVVDKMRAEGRPVPPQIADLAERHVRDRSWKDAVHSDPVRLVGRIGGKNVDVTQLRRGYEEAVARVEQERGDDHTEIIFWCVELAEKYLADCKREDLRKAEKCLEYAHRGLDLLDPANETHCMLGFRLTQTAARAELLLSTKRLRYETKGLSRIRSLKEREIQFADALGWELKAELARFHRDRSAALCDDRVEPEIASIRWISSTLLDRCRSRAHTPQDQVPADELAGVIFRLCAIEMAYSEDGKYGDAFRAAFPDGAAKVKDELLQCFGNASGDARQEHDDTAALIRLQELDATLRQARRDGAPLGDVIKGYEQAPVDLLRSARFGIIRHVLVARYLVAKAEAKLLEQRGFAGGPLPDEDGSPIHASSRDLIESAIYFYSHAEAVTRRRGAGGKLRYCAKKERDELIDSYENVCNTYDDPPAVGAVEVEEFQRAINDLLLKVFTWRTKLDADAMQGLRDLIEPVGRYLERNQK